jgi:hypothetical protein
MTEGYENRPEQDGTSEDPSPAVADSQAPAHLEERGLDTDLEAALDNGSGASK